MRNLFVLAAPLAMSACVGIDLEPMTVDDKSDVGVLTLGTNTFVGQVSGTCPGDNRCTISKGRDEFDFSVAEGTAITGIRASAVGTGPNGFRMKAVIKDMEFKTDRAPYLTGVRFPLDGQPRNGLVGFLDRTPVAPVPAYPDYIMEVGTSDNIVGPGSFDVTYTLELDVQFVAPQ